jgi:2-polyprenyl-3-methyl-5-hydroxy-6-metoxy-1,4-benzoquinol methylase
MRYRVRGLDIRSENAAKPHMQRSQAVVQYLRRLNPAESVLDFGCGKLRYADLIAKLGTQALLVDSQIQLTRKQRVRGKMSTVADVAISLYSNVKVLASEKLDSVRDRYDIVTCINVLSVIPDRAALREALRTIRRLTKRSGFAVFVNQHRNTYFKQFAGGTPHLFGHLYQGRNGASYYGIMTKERVEKLLRRAGFTIGTSWNDREINFVEAYPVVT